MKNNLDSITNSLIAGKTKQAIDKLLKLNESLENENDDVLNEIRNNVVLISSTFEENRKKQNLSLKTAEEISIQKNKIIISILNILNDYKNYFKEKISIKERKGEPGLFSKVSANKMMTDLCTYIKVAKSIRVIGEGRQEKFDKEPISSISNYYDALIERCSHDFDGKHPLTYRRITNRALSRKYKTHLENCFQLVEKNKNNLKVIFYGDLCLAYTYFIIDTIDGESMLILNAYVEDNDIEVIDTKMVYYTYDKETINEFKKHFKNAWEKEANSNLVIKDLKEYKFFTPFDSDIDKRLNNVIKYSKRIPKNSIRIEHLRYHVREFEKRLKGIVYSKLEVPHTDKNQRISTAYLWYLKTLEKGCNYKTVSVLEFWKGMQDFNRFLNAHRDRFEKRDNAGSVTRIYVIDEDQITDLDYIKSHGDIVSENFELAKEFPENYEFKVLFVKDYNNFLSTNRNFAIWSKDNKYRTVFLSEYPSNFTRKGKTNIYFIEDWNNEHKNYFSNRSKYLKASNSINKRLKESFAQKDKLKYYFHNIENESNLKSLTKEEIETADNRLKFLLKCGVDVERYLY